MAKKSYGKYVDEASVQVRKGSTSKPRLATDDIEATLGEDPIKDTLDKNKAS